jgi:hypothetical protein
MKHETLTDDQRKVAEEIGDDLGRAFDAAREKLVGFHFDPDASSCTLCGCGGFTGFAHNCKTPGCGHLVQRHLNRS